MVKLSFDGPKGAESKSRDGRKGVETAVVSDEELANLP